MSDLWNAARVVAIVVVLALFAAPVAAEPLPAPERPGDP